MSRRTADLSNLLPSICWAGSRCRNWIDKPEKCVGDSERVKESAQYLSPSAAAVSEMIESGSCEPVTAPIWISPLVHAARAIKATDSFLKNLAANV